VDDRARRPSLSGSGGHYHAGSSTAAVQLRGVAKAFRTSHGVVDAVRELDAAISPGETVALLGPNGAGKSTSLDMLLGLTSPDRGEVSLLGRRPRTAVDEGLVGAMLQAGALMRDVSPRELVAMVVSLYPDSLDVDDALELAGVREIADRRTQKLSGGQAQRVRLAVALASDPEVLVLDEPTVGLDVQSRRGFWRSMRAFAARGRTVVFATHYLDEADAHADRAILMSHGRVVAEGPTTEIRARVGRRTIRATVGAAEVERLGRLPGVARVDRRGATVALSCFDSDAAIRALLDTLPAVSDIEIASAPLEDAFVELTHAPEQPGESAPLQAVR
jgi:ABC-2 type transport system ATP-binding protein